MELEVADPLLPTTESKDAITKRKALDVEDGLLYYSEEGLGKRNIHGEPLPVEQKSLWKSYIQPFLNMLTFVIAAAVVLKDGYSVQQGEHWYSNVLLVWALVCYALGSLLGIGLKFVEGRLLSTYFPKVCADRKFSYEDLETVGAGGFWHKWVLVLSTCLYVEVTACIVGSLVGLSNSLSQGFPVARAMTLSWFTLEPSTVLIVIFIAVMILPMRYNTKFDLTWFGLGPLYIANSFPWGFPMYRVIVGILCNYFKLVESHKEHNQAKAAAQKYFAS